MLSEYDKKLLNVIFKHFQLAIVVNMNNKNKEKWLKENN